MYPGFILNKGMRMYFFGDLVIIDKIINCFFDYPTFDNSGNMVVSFIIDDLRLNEIDEMFLGDHFDLGEVCWFIGFVYIFECKLRLAFSVFCLFYWGIGLEDLFESFDDNAFGEVVCW